MTGNRWAPPAVQRVMRIPLPLAALLLLAAAACGDQSSTAGAGPGSDGPWGRDFLSTAVTEHGQERPLANGTRIRLGFTEDGRLVASAGCNTMSGQAEIRDGRLVVADLATTEMGCDSERHAQDEWLAGFLSSRPRVDLAGDDLTLTGGGAEIRLRDREVADPDRALYGTRWVVDTVVDGDAASSVPRGAEAHAVLNEDGTFGGSTGCNQMGGRATVDDAGGTIAFAEVVATKMACDEAKMALERSVLAVLDGTVTHEVEADRLTLTHPSGKGLGLRATQ